MAERIFLLLGSNLGTRQDNLLHATTLIEHEVGKIVKASGFYQTAAWGITDQPYFLNQALEITSALDPAHLLTTLLSIESRMGRIRKEKWGERIIDIDMLYYGKHILQSNLLTLPHPGIAYRRFVLEPLAEIAPDFVHPLLNKPTTLLLEECKDSLTVMRLD